MIARRRVLGLVLLALFAVWFVAPRTIVSGQYANGPLIWVDFQVLNQTKHMQLSGLGSLLLTEALDLRIDAPKHHAGAASLTMSGGGGYHIGESASTQATFWTGDDNQAINTIDYNLLSVSTDGSTAVCQTIHVFNVPGAVAFSLGVTYMFGSKGNYEVVASLTVLDSNVQNSINLQVSYP